MSRGFRWLLLAVVLLGFAGSALLIVSRETESPNVSAQANPRNRSARLGTPKADEVSFEEVVVVCQVPARHEPLSEVSGGGHGPSCPASKVSSLLGIAIDDPHGINIGSVVFEGPAAQAGILPGDGITKCFGEAVDCPRNLLPLLGQEEERRPVELTLRRPIRPAEGGGDEADEPEQTSPEADERLNQ